MSRILVAGGAGFLGSHLCEALLGQGHDVICLDNFCTGTEASIAPLFSSPGFSFIEHDVTEPFFMEVDQIYNLACPASPMQYQENAIRTIRTSVLGAMTVLEMAKQTGARVLQASTSEVYGDPTVHPQPESYWGHANPIGIRSCYDEGKRCAESLFVNYQRQHGVKIKNSRIFNTYGPKMQLNDGRVVSNFIVSALRGEPLVIYGEGRQTRSFCYVSDMVTGLINLMDTSDEFTGPMNLGNSGEFTILQLARLVLELTGSSSQIVFETLPEDDPVQRQPELTLAESVIGWKPGVDLRDGLLATIAYFRTCIS